MTSDRKAEANRQNALKSTGPKTLEGKTAVRLNAVKHGLLAEEILLPGRRSSPEEVRRSAEDRTATRGGTGKHVRRSDHFCPLETAPPGPGGRWHIHLQILWYPLRLPRDGGNAGS